jgi:diguanylate cyclase (GGDEF)-like protein/PAS domain S-box-containing protein
MAVPEWIGLLVEAGIEALVVFTDDFTLTYANDAAAEMVGYPADVLLGRNVLELVHPEDMERAAVNVAGMVDGARPEPGIIRLLRGDGEWGEYELSPLRVDAPPPPDGPGPLTGIVLRDHAVRETHWTFLARLAAGDEFHDCLHSLAVGLSGPVDGPLGISYQDGDARRLAGVLPSELAGIAVGRLDRTTGTPWGEAVATNRAVWQPVDDVPEPFRSRALREGLAAVVAVPVPDPSHDEPALLVQWPSTTVMGPVLAQAIARRPREAVAIALERRSATERLEYLALRDPLTGLANRAYFFETLARLDREGTPYAVLYLDLDRFKPVNDTYGHVAGDEVLEICARRMVGLARRRDLVARLGGDEFAIVCADATPDTAGVVADRVVAALAEPMHIGGREFLVGVSVGVAVRTPTTAADEVVAAADAALYEAKRAGRGTWRISL